MTKITRTIVTNTAKVFSINAKNGVVETQEREDFVVVDTKQLSEEQMLKLLKKESSENLIITSVTYDEKVIGLDLDLFMKYGKEVNRPSSQTK